MGKNRVSRRARMEENVGQYVLDKKKGLTESVRELSYINNLLTKLDKMKMDSVVPAFHYNGKLTNIVDEIIYLNGFGEYWVDNRTTLDSFKDLHNAVKDLKLTASKAAELDAEIIKTLDKFEKSDNILLKSPDNVLIVNNVRWMHMLYNTGFYAVHMYTYALKVVLMYLAFIINRESSLNELDYFKDDEVCMLCMYSAMAWLMDEEAKGIYDSEISRLIKKYIAGSLDEMLAKDENRFKDLYIEYKHICNDEHTDEERESFWSDKRDTIMSDFGKFNIESITSGFNHDNVSGKERYVRCVDDSFKNMFSDYYDSLSDVENEKDRYIIYYLISRYLLDVNELLSIETVTNMRKAMYYALANTRAEGIEEQAEKDINKIREQSKFRVNRYKKEMALVKEQLAFHKNKNAKLTKELEKIDKNAVKTLTEEVEELRESNNKLKKTQGRHDLEKARLENKIKELEQTATNLQKQKDNLEREYTEQATKQMEHDSNEGVTFQSKDIPANILYNAIKDKKILLVGGDRIHSSIIERGYNNIELLKSENVNVTMHSTQKYDLVIIYTKYVGHTILTRVESELKNTGIPIIRFNQSGINTLLYTIFMYVYGGGNELVGEYTL